MSHETAPIIVTGNPRSGTTWMQWFLSQHQRIHIHGQAPNLPWSEMWGWKERMAAQGAWAQRSRQYAVAHYAGSPPPRCGETFKRMYYEYMTGLGPEKPRWGIKALWMCSLPEPVQQIESLWPDIRWVVCIRDPVRSLNSIKNTFVADMDPMEWFRRWANVARFALEHADDRTTVFQIDKVAPAEADVRLAKLNAVLERLGESPTAATTSFVRRWPIVHQVAPANRRRFAIDDAGVQQALEDIPDLKRLMKKFSYKPAPAQEKLAR